jgi:hypothetical protein
VNTNPKALVVLSPKEKLAYKHCFLLADTDKDGALNTLEAVNFLRKSSLDKSHLAEVCADDTNFLSISQIWNLVIKDNSRAPGAEVTLSPLAFSLAMRLISLIQSGKEPKYEEMAKVQGG